MLKWICAILPLLAAQPAFAAEQFGSPVRVMLSFKDAHITAEQEVPVVVGKDGRAEVRFLLPDGASGVSVEARDRIVEGWSGTKKYLDEAFGEAQEKELVSVEGEIQAIEARLALWKTGSSKELSFDDLDKRDGRMRQIIPELHARLHELQNQAKVLKFKRDNQKKMSRQAVLAAVSLSGPAEGKVNLVYSYTTNQCRWRPVYRFTALPDRGVVLARLNAEIRQDSGQDWNNVEITLVSHNAGGRAPSDLLPWLVVNSDLDRRKKDAPMAAESAVFAMAPQEPRSDNDKEIEIPLKDGGAFVSWELGRRAVRAGVSLLTIREAEWKAPIFRLARPAQSRNAFIAARCVVDDPRAWPSGSADFFLDGATAGSADFALDGNKAALFFGADPRVTVERETDSRQSGRSGILVGKRQSWEWKWTFKAFNGHAKPILLRVEDAAPQARDKDIAIAVNSKPEHKLDEKHVLYWELTIPANKGADIVHSVTLAAPEDMSVRPGR